jgi:hypothetical protein
MATTKITLSLDVVALSLARGAAELSGESVSAVVSGTLARHLLADYAPPALPPDHARDRREAAAAAAELELADAAEHHDGHGYGHRAAG